MAQTAYPCASSGSSSGAKVQRRSGSALVLCAIALVVIAIALQSYGHLDGDDSWFITFAEKYLDGARPYVDVSDPNPPAAFLVYVPAVYLARICKLKPEFIVALFTFLGAGLAILLSGGILRRAGLLSAAELPGAMALAAYICLIAAAYCFAEREHFAFLLLLPMSATLAARAAGRDVGLPEALLAGSCAGCATCFKPYFLVPLAFVCGYLLCVGAIHIRRMMLEFTAMATVMLIYAVTIVLAYPAYLDNLQLVLDVYAPVRDSFMHLIGSPLLIVNGVLLTAWAYLFSARRRRGEVADIRSLVAALFSIGFLATFLIQGKGWANHAYPGISFAIVALAAELRSQAVGGNVQFASGAPRQLMLFLFVPILCATPFLFDVMRLLTNAEEHPGLTATVSKLAPPHPGIAALAEQLDFGHPLVRQIGGRWVGRQNCLWISWGVKYLRIKDIADPVIEARRAQYLGADLTMFAEDIRVGRPDILLIESKALEVWARAQPVLSDLFAAYVLTATAGEVEIWQPKS
jgi:hypothetical protein